MFNSDNFSAILQPLTAFNVATIVAVIVGTWLSIFLLRKGLTWASSYLSGRRSWYVLAWIPVTRLVLLVAAFLTVVPLVVQPTYENFVAIAGASGLAIGFAFKDYVSSLVAGAVTLFEIPFRPGDWVEIEGHYGEIRSIGMRSFQMVTPDDTRVFVPHLKLWNCQIGNANRGGQDLQCIADFYLKPDHDSAQARQILEEVAWTSPDLQIKQPITVLVREKPWATHYRLKAYPIEPRDQFAFITDLTVRGKEALSQAGFEFSQSLPYNSGAQDG